MTATAVAIVAGLSIMLVAQSPANAEVETLFPDTVVPATTVDPDRTSVELGLTFSVTTPGTVVGVRYYGTRDNTGTHTGSLWSSGGERLSTATFPASTGAGWQSVDFDEPVPVVPGRTYVASYLAPSGRYAAAEGGFTRGVERGHITVPRDGGVFVYGQDGGFPRYSWHSSNYYVDVRFVPDQTDGPTTSPTDTTAPTSTPTATGGPSGTATPTTSPTQTPTSSPTRPTPSQTPTTSPTPPTTKGCAPNPGTCGYPDAASTGVSAGTTLRTLGSQTITTPGTVLENAVINGNIEVQANNVTIRNVRIIENGQTWGIGLRHATNTTIEHVDIQRGAGGARLEVGIKDVYGDASGTRITNSDISGTSTGIQTHEGLVQDNYIHDFGYQAGDHLNGVCSNGSTAPMTIDHNTILNNYDQTDAIALFQDFGLEANRTVTDNLIAGGSYTLYAGGGSKGVSHHITISGNRFSRQYFQNSGVFGPVTAFDRNGTGNTWSNNIWDDTGAAVLP